MQIQRFLFKTPARISVIGFGILIAVGTGLLMLPSASTIKSPGFINALFTSVSACCVTGLVVVNTGSTFSTFGQVVILGLIQAGGLGIMTISTLALMIGGRRPSLSERVVIQDTFTNSGERNLSFILRNVILFTFVIEGVGALLMFFRFLPGRTVCNALFISIFHSISAFCNAGFSLFPDSLIAFREDWILNLVICFLIICGGIGFLVLLELKHNFPFKRSSWSRLSLHSKLVISTTSILLVTGSLLIMLMEWHNTLSPLTIPGRFLASFFQAVSARTAGFNTLPVGKMADETLFLLALLMFIGASPGSCGGGIKTTTLAALISLGVSRLRGREHTQIFHRTISNASLGKAISMVIISIALIAIFVMSILTTELGQISHLQSRGKFLELFFEIISAFGTAGLSTGVTGGLSLPGKLIVIAVMFIGRLGPLVIAIAISRLRETPHFYYAKENIMIG
ncbi:MAG: hypothetical protein J7L16_03540 [Deltaproteobacteria bacterium]|nr:hypothetical protein [Deltaproteobacteria bacterium]